MYRRTITIDASPPQNIDLHYRVRENALKPPVPNGVFLVFLDDFEKRLCINTKESAVISDVMVDVMREYEMLAALEIEKIYGEQLLLDAIKENKAVEFMLQKQKEKS